MTVLASASESDTRAVALTNGAAGKLIQHRDTFVDLPRDSAPAGAGPSPPDGIIAVCQTRASTGS